MIMRRLQLIRWALLCAVFAIIMVGALILMLTPNYDPDHPAMTWGGLGLAALCFVLGMWLGHYLDNRNMLPE